MVLYSGQLDVCSGATKPTEEWERRQTFLRRALIHNENQLCGFNTPSSCIFTAVLVATLQENEQKSSFYTFLIQVFAVVSDSVKDSGLCRLEGLWRNWPGAQRVSPQTDRTSSTVFLHPVVQVEDVSGQSGFTRLPSGVSETSLEDMMNHHNYDCFLIDWRTRYFLPYV